MAVNTTSPTPDYARARLCVANGRYGEAIAECEYGSHAQPDVADWRYLQAIACYGAGNPAAARTSLLAATGTGVPPPPRAAELVSFLLARGEVAEAEELVRRWWDQPAAGPELSFALAATLYAAGRPALAAEGYRRVVRVLPDAAEVHNNLGVALEASGDLHGARASFERALALKPDYVRALNNLGKWHLAAGDVARARALLEQAVARGAGHAEALTNLGNAARADGDLDAAIAAHRSAVAAKPDFVAAHVNLAHALLARGDHADALAACDKALSLDPRSIDALRARASVQGAGGAHVAALASLECALVVDPGSRELRCDYARAHAVAGNQARALSIYEALLGEDGASAELWAEYGSVALAQASESGDEAGLARAVDAYEQAIRREPAHVVARRTLAFLHLDRHDLARAEPLLAALAAEYPADAGVAEALLGLRCARADWTGYHELVAAMRAGVESGAALNPMGLCVRIDDPLLQRRCAAQFVASLGLAGDAPSVAPRARAPGERLRVGYLSSDFREHVVASSIVGILESHDRDEVEVVGIGTTPADGTALGARVRNACERFCDVAGAATGEAAARVRALQLDVLIDLTGFTTGARARLLARRLAPVQAGYLGYPGTSGAPWMDYLIVDRFLVPDAAAQGYGERLVRLPGTFFAGEPPAAPEVAAPSRAAEGLPEHAIVYCNFNQTQRLGPDAFALFLDVLAATPGSVLWLHGSGGAAANLRAAAQAAGVSPERLVFARFAANRTVHLARHALADLFLDSLPYNAHSTARDALQWGLPVLTLPGRSFASRVAGSVLTGAQLGELVASDRDDYIAKAAHYAGNPDAREALRARLAQGVTQAAFQVPARQARHLEAAYRWMDARVRSGLPPVDVDVPAC